MSRIPTITKILRHSAEQLGIPIDSCGFVDIDILLPHLGKNIKTKQDLEKYVSKDKKGRFEIVGDRVRSVQGHTIKSITSGIEKITEPISNVCHGTYSVHLQSIQETGLQTMGRNHIHMIEDVKLHMIRKDIEVLLYIDMEKAMENGIEFFKSKNGVILSSGIDGVIHWNYIKEIKFK